MEDNAVKTGRWEIRQDRETMGMALYLDEVKKDEWDADRIYSFDELHEILRDKSYELIRSERDGIRQ